MRSAVLLLLGLVSGCGTTGGGEVAIPLIAGGASDARSFTASGWSVTMDDARIALGPMYFCATTSADLENCPAAMAELRGAVTVDVLDGTTDTLGTLVGRAGTLRSGMWDYGRPFLLPASEPTPIAGAIDGHSARFSGTASNGATSFRFVAVIDVDASMSGLAAVAGVRTTHTLVDDADALTVRFDVIDIVGRLDFDALATQAVDGQVEIIEGSTAYNALVQALARNALPDLEWARSE